MIVLLASTMPGRAADHERGLTDPVARMRIAAGQGDVARARLVGELESDPDNTDLASMYGEASALSGYFADAYTGFQLGRDAEAYGCLALKSDADVQRWLGPVGTAARIRNEIAWCDPTDQQALSAYLDLVDDSRADGDLDAAWEAALAAVSLASDRGGPYAQLAEVLMDLGRWDEARAWIDVGNLLGPRSSYLVRAEVRQLVHDARTSEARDRALLATQENRTDLELRALRADAATADGDPATGLWVVQGQRFEGIDHPLMLLAEIHALEGTGATEQATALRARFRTLYARPVLSAIGVRESP